MIVYLDASALVKRYVAEAGSSEVGALTDAASALGTSIVSRAEVSAALARAVRLRVLTRPAGTAAQRAFAGDWADLIRVQLGEPLIARAASLAWEHGLRGYDAVHLASALWWREAVGDAVTVATYDRALWRSARAAGLAVWPGR